LDAAVGTSDRVECKGRFLNGGAEEPASVCLERAARGRPHPGCLDVGSDAGGV